MSTELQETKGGAMTMPRDELRATLRSSLYPGAADQSIDMVLSYCQAAGLDVMLKPVHIVPMWDSKMKEMRDVVMPGIGMYRIQASRSGDCAGVGEPEFGPMVTQTLDGAEISYPEWCRVTTKRLMRNGAIAEFTAIEFWIENYAVKGGQTKSIAPNAMWSKRPRGQLAKCAQAQSLRLAFPEVGAAPTAEEMEGKSFGGDTVQTAVAQGRAEPEPYPPDQFDRNMPLWQRAITEGKKTADEIIAMVETKGTLTDKQKAAIRDCAPVEGELVEDAA